MDAGIRPWRSSSGDVYERLELVSSRLEAGFAAAASAAGLPFTSNRVGSMLTGFFTATKVVDYKTAKTSDTARFGRFFRAMLARGVYLAPSQYEAAFVSLAHTDEDIDQTISAAQSAMREIG